MGWSSHTPPARTHVKFKWLLWLGLAIVLPSALLPAGLPTDQRITIYSVAANYSLPVSERNGQDYVGLLEALDPLGTVSAKTDSTHWKLIYNGREFEFTANKTRVRSKNGEFDLPSNFLLESGRGLVSLGSLASALPRILGGPVDLHAASRRLFIGSVATHFTAVVVQSNPPRLVMNFTSPVSPAITQEPRQLHLVFSREPIVAPGSLILTFGNAVIPSASYGEENGAAEITVSGTVPLSASVSSDGRTITVMPTQSVTPSKAVEATPVVQSSPGPNSRRYFAVVDASHGGSERGAALNDQLAEKDVTLQFARRLRQELEARGISTLILRDGDATLTLDQRANTANAAHAAVYIALHAASQGNGVRIYTALLPPPTGNRGPFLDWNTAQSSFRGISEIAEGSVMAQLQRNQIAVRTMAAALRPLNNITSAAIAIEVAPQQNDLAELTSVAYQQAVCYSIASGIVGARERLEAGR